MKKISIVFWVGIIILIIALTIQIVFWYQGNFSCPNFCFNKDGELWCEMGCWNLMKKYNSTPNINEVPTECQDYPNLSWCKLKN
jgi:hypothetical protein